MLNNLRQELRTRFNKSNRITKILIILTLITFGLVILSAFLTALFNPQEDITNEPDPVIQGEFTPPPYRPPLPSPIPTPSIDDQFIEEPSTDSARP